MIFTSNNKNKILNLKTPEREVNIMHSLLEGFCSMNKVPCPAPALPPAPTPDPVFTSFPASASAPVQDSHSEICYACKLYSVSFPFCKAIKT